MGRRQYKPEQIIHMLREAEIKLAVGQTTGEVCRALGIAEQATTSIINTIVFLESPP